MDSVVNWVKGTSNEVIVAEVLAATIAVLGVTGVVSSSVVVATLLAALAVLLALLSSLRSHVKDLEAARHQERMTLKRVEAMMEAGAVASAVFRNEYPDLGSFLKESDHVTVVAGLSLKTSVGQYYAAFQEGLARGAEIRFVCPDPDDLVLMDQAGRWGPNRSTGEQAARDVRANLDIALHLRDANAERCEVRVVAALPSLGIILFRKGESADMLVKLLPAEAAAGRYPVFHVRAEADPELFATLARSVDALWAAAAPA